MYFDWHHRWQYASVSGLSAEYCLWGRTNKILSSCWLLYRGDVSCSSLPILFWACSATVAAAVGVSHQLVPCGRLVRPAAECHTEAHGLSLPCETTHIRCIFHPLSSAACAQEWRVHWLMRAEFPAIQDDLSQINLLSVCRKGVL